MTVLKSVLPLLAASFLIIPQAHAAEPDPAAKKEAAARFDRGLDLFDQGDNAGALAEFKRTYELMPNPIVQYNLGLVYAAMGRSVEAVDALTAVLATKGLSAQQQARAQKTLAEQQARIGRLAVTTTPEAARIEIDGVEVAKTPLAAPIRLPEGTHVVGAIAEGFSPTRKEVLVASNADTSLHFDLIATEGKRLANLLIHTRIAAADVLLDGQKIGKTPLVASLAIAAGHHKIELHRPGYTKAEEDLNVDEGGSAEVELQPTVDTAALGAEGGTLEIDARRGENTLFVDGSSLGPYSTPVRLPRGPHHVRLEVAGFQPFERDVNVDPSQSNVLKVVLEPTAETRAAHDTNVSRHRTFGWIGVATGAVIAGAGVALLATNSSSAVSKAQKDLNTAKDARTNQLAPYCDTNDAFNGMNGAANCDAYVANQQANLDSAQSNHATKNAIGYVGIGVGSAVLITGIVLLFTGDDPHEFDRPTATSGKGANRTRVAVIPGPGNFGAGVALAF
jgi:hypothetical protein